MRTRGKPAAPRTGWFGDVDSVLRHAHSQGRKELYEHEVYEILSSMGIRTPAHAFVRDERDITRGLLSDLKSPRVVLKVASRDVAHKQREGGVKVLACDLDFARYSFREMKTSFERRGSRVEGALLAEFVDYSKDLGNENLLGFRESAAFGPVISFSKGGTDAEHFASNFSAPNLILAPIDHEWASALQASTKIQKKYLEEGKTEYIAKIVETEVKLSSLAVQFSNFFASESVFAIVEFEVNPFVFDRDGGYIAIDGYAVFDLKDEGGFDLEVPPKETLKPLFEPKGIAVVGVSAVDGSKSGNIILRNLLDLGRDDLHGVNPKGGHAAFGIPPDVGLAVAGGGAEGAGGAASGPPPRGGPAGTGGAPFPLLRSVLDIGPPVDLAVVTVPAEAVVRVVEECARKGVKAVILIPGGFGEVNKNLEAEERILSIARKAGMRVMGPNCLGVVHAGEGKNPGLNTFLIPGEKFRISLKGERNVAILSQSGALGITEIYNLRNSISPKVVVSYGNQLDIDPSDLVRYFEDDPMVEVIALYIEGFKRGAGRKFFDVTSGCTKPLIVYKAGRTEAGRKAARSHTASISGEYEVAKAAMRQAGLIVADTMIDHGDFIKTFALLNDFTVRGRRTAIIANAGYEKTYAADNLRGLELAELDGRTGEKLRAIIPPFVSVEPLLDLTAMASDELFERCIDLFLASPNVDALCVSIVPQAQVLHTTDEEIDRYEKNVAARIVEVVHRHKKPVVVSINVVSGADAAYNKFGEVMDSGGVPTFLTAERAMVCLDEFIRYKLVKEKRLYSEWLKA